MADNESINPQVKTLTAGEAGSLADRLFSRSVSKLFETQPEVQRDCCMASRVIRALLSEVDRLASECEDKARLLRNIQIDIRGC
jgi:hypothetical protein